MELIHTSNKGDNKEQRLDLYQQMMDYFKRHQIWPTEGEHILNTDDPDYEFFHRQRQNMERATNEFIKRRDFVKEYGWAIPNKQALEAIREFVDGDSILEVGAGRGFWAKLLQDMGLDVVATDAFKTHGYMPDTNTHYTPVENMDHNTALSRYSNRKVLLLCWPPYDDPMAYEALKNFKGNKFIYIGEGYGGCTGCDYFHYILSEWHNIERINIPNWFGIHDYVSLLVRG